jgi:hypothetical protein
VAAPVELDEASFTFDAAVLAAVFTLPASVSNEATFSVCEFLNNFREQSAGFVYLNGRPFR